MLACGALGGADLSREITHNIHRESSVDLLTWYKTLKYGGPVHLCIKESKGNTKLNPLHTKPLTYALLRCCTVSQEIYPHVVIHKGMQLSSLLVGSLP